MSKVSKYSIFTKDELVDFLDKYEDRFKSYKSVYGFLMQEKINKKNEEIKANIDEGVSISKAIDSTDDIFKKIEQMDKFQENHKKWEKLSKELDSLYEKMKKYF